MEVPIYSPTPKKDFVMLLSMIAVIAIPAFLALRSIHIPGELVFPSDVHKPMQKVYPLKCSPYGYTWSLSIFIAPILTSWIYLHYIIKKYKPRLKHLKYVNKAFWLTIGILIPIGFILDLVLGNLFFDFPNQGATLGIHLPGYDFEKGTWKLDLPIEEFIFYATGFIAILSIYIWGNEDWFETSNRYKWNTRHGLLPPEMSTIIAFRPITGITIGAVLIAGAVLYKKFGPHGYHDGFPGYFTYLVAVAIVPAILFLKTARELINWRAFSFTLFFVLLISLLWEATLASPYGWWRYNYDQMMGLVINPWSGLPIEAALLWLVVTFTTTIVYETIFIWVVNKKRLPKRREKNGDTGKMEESFRGMNI